MKITREVVLATTACVLLAVVVVRALMAMRPQESMTSFADRAQEALAKGDADQLYRYLSPQDKKNITPQQFDLLVSWRNASFDSFKLTTDHVDSDLKGEYGLKRARTFESPDGTTFQEQMVFERGPDGPIISAFWLLEGAFKARYMSRHMKEPIMLRTQLCARDALKNDAPALNTFGREVFVNGKMTSWEDLRVQVEVFLEDRRRKIENPMWPGFTEEERAARREAIRSAIRSGKI